MKLAPLLVLLACATQVAALDLVVDGRSDYVIVLAVDAIPAEKFAAEELASHIKQISGAELKVISDAGPLPKQAILLGRPRYLAELGVTPDWEQLGKEGHLIRTVKNHLIIAGGRPRGTMYGVYDLLQEHWGCRWFTFDTSHIPKKSTLTVPNLDAMNRPVFELRDIMVLGGYYGRGFRDKRDNLRSSRIDDPYVPRSRWNFVTRDWRNKYETHGGSVKIVWGPAHNYLWLVDYGKYGVEHPEYYALVDGKRLNHRIRGNEVELCLSNPDVAQVAAKTIAGWLRECPDKDPLMCFIGQSDTDKYCQCDNCDAVRKKYGGWDSARRVQIPGNLPEEYWNLFGGFAGLQIEFANKVAEILETEFPDVRIGTFAYMHALKPPRGIKAHRNVVVWYCPYPRRCYCHSVDSGPINDDFQNFGAELGEWKRIANYVYVYDYWLETWMGQPINIPTLRRTMRFYRKLGVEGVLLDGIRGVPGGFEWLTFWLWFQLAWNPDFDVDQGIDEFCTAYYGAAAPYIRQYIEMACRPESYGMTSVASYRPGTGRHRTKWLTDDPYKPIKLDKLRKCQMGFRNRVMTTKAINLGYKLFEQARKAVANDPKALKHVEYSRMSLQFAMVEWLPGTDPRLKDEGELLIRLGKELEMQYIGYSGTMTLDKYREAIRKKIELGAPIYPPKRKPPTVDKQSGFGITPPSQGHYVDGKDFLNLLPKLRLVGSLPLDGWLFKDDPEKIGTEQDYYKPGYASGDLAKIKIGEHWDSQGYGDLEEGWYRFHYKCPDLPGGKRVFLRFGAVDESAWLYVDGKLVAWYDTAFPKRTWTSPFLLEVTGSLKSQEEHLLVVRVGNTVGGGGIYKPVSLMVEK